MTVDTIYWLYNHLNSSGLNDTVIVSLYAVSNSPTGISFTNATEKEFSNTLLWSDSIITNTSLTPTAGTSLFYGNVVPGGIAIPAGEGFVVRIDYLGPKQDIFMLADGYRLECSNNGAASPSVVSGNSFRYLNVAYGHPCVDSSGTNSITFPTLPANCNQFYFQNIAISAVVTIDAPLSVNPNTTTAIGCPGQTITLNAGAGGGSGDYSYTWSGNGTITSPNTALTNVVLPSTNAVETYTIEVVDNIENTTVTRTVNVTIGGITADLGPDETVNCGFTQSLAPIVSGFQNGISYAWSTGAISQSISVSNPGIYSVTVTNSAGCTATDSKIYSLNINQVVSFATTASYNGGSQLPVTSSTPLCPGADLTFTNTSIDTSNNWTFEWNYGDGTSSTGINGSHVYNNTGSYTITLTAQSTTSACTITNDITITVRTVNAQVFINSAPIPACADTGSITFTALPINGGNPTYQWQLNGIDTGSNSPTLVLNGLAINDEVSCIMTSSQSCLTAQTVSSNTITISSCVGIQEVLQALQFSAQPNPSAGMFYLNADGKNHDQWHISIYDLTGREILNQTTQSMGLQQHPIDLSKVGKGVYILRLNNGTQQGYRRVVVY